MIYGLDTKLKIYLIDEKYENFVHFILGANKIFFYNFEAIIHT
jgi:hypothetical protein